LADIVTFVESEVDAFVALCAAEGWPSWTRARSLAALTAPGVIALAALEGDELVGAAQLVTDGAVVAYLGLLIVAPAARGRGVGRALVRELFARSGLERIDLLSTDEAVPFYESFPHRRKPGVRIYA
jgi:ribosomal protein S18 acetylase RimI-like enzyme